MNRAVGQLYDAELRLAGLKTTQYSLLSGVLLMGPVRPSDLAAGLRMDASTLTRNLRPLLEAGWVGLGPGADGRSRLVHITEAGRAKRAEARHHWRAAQDRLNHLLGEDRVRALHAVLDDALAQLAVSPVEPEAESVSACQRGEGSRCSGGGTKG